MFSSVEINKTYPNESKQRLSSRSTCSNTIRHQDLPLAETQRQSVECENFLMNNKNKERSLQVYFDCRLLTWVAGFLQLVPSWKWRQKSWKLIRIYKVLIIWNDSCTSCSLAVWLLLQIWNQSSIFLFGLTIVRAYIQSATSYILLSNTKGF